MKKILLALFFPALTLLSAQTESVHFTKIISYSIMKFDWNVNVYYSDKKLFIKLPDSGILIESGRAIPVSYDPDKNIIRKNIGSFQNPEITYTFEDTNIRGDE